MPKSVTNAIPVAGVTEHDITIDVVIIEDDDVNAIAGDDDDVIALWDITVTLLWLLLPLIAALEDDMSDNGLTEDVDGNVSDDEERGDDDETGVRDDVDTCDDDTSDIDEAPTAVEAGCKVAVDSAEYDDDDRGDEDDTGDDDDTSEGDVGCAIDDDVVMTVDADDGDDNADDE